MCPTSPQLHPVSPTATATRIPHPQCTLPCSSGDVAQTKGCCLPPPQFWGGCSSGGAGFAQPLAQRCAPAQGLKLSSPTWLRPRHDGHESSPRRDPVLAGNPRRQELGGTLGCTQVIHVVFESRCLAHASPHFLSVMFCIM